MSTTNFSVQIEMTTKPKPRPDENNLGFGRFFSDHMFVSDSTWTNPKIIPYQPLQLDPAASVLHYGQAIFEGLKAFRGDDNKIRLFRPDMNWQRMQNSANRLCMKFCSKEFFIDSLKSLVRVEADWIPHQQTTALYLRPTLIGTEGFLGVRPSSEYLYYLIASPVGNYYGPDADAVSIWVEPTLSRAANGGIGAAKAGGNYASSLLAAMQAKTNGYSQVLWLDAGKKEMVEEVGTMNVFFCIGDRIVTPNLSGTILPGVMRDSAIQWLEKVEGISVEQRPVSLKEILQAAESGELKEIFGTGTAASISPVGKLGFKDPKLATDPKASLDRQIMVGTGKAGPIASMLFKKLTDVQYGRAPDRLGWTIEV